MQKMFGLFESKEKKLLKRFKEISDQIDAAGGPQSVCQEFGSWFAENELRRIIGIMPESQSPYPKALLMTAALRLLDTVKKSSSTSADIDETLLLYAESAYVGSAFLSEDRVIKPILEEMQSTTIVPKQKLAPFFDLAEKHKRAWKDFVLSDVDVNQICNVNLKN
jgi:hypothetical protein